MDHVIILPNSLFEENSLINKNSKVYILEHPVYFTLFKYHKLKLILHRATMKYYHEYIKKKYKCKVKYYDINSLNKKNALEKLLKSIKNEVHLYDPADHIVMKELKKITKKLKMKLIVHDTPLFMSKLDDLSKYIDDKGNDRITHGHFYKWQRIRFNVLLTSNKKPKGGKWSFDVQNRKPFPKNFNKDFKNNFIPKSKKNKYINEAKKYVNKHFKNNPGSDDNYVSIDYDGAKKDFNNFLKERFKCFGPYQDAVDKKIPFGCHSVISPYLNIGLLTPKYVIEKAEEYGLKNDVPKSSLEGFIRQILGWREYVRMMYMFKRKELDQNFFNHRRQLNDKIWFQNDGSTGFDVIDDMLDKTFKYAYLHHIERLMYIGNFMLITNIYPEQSFKWFMELFIDSYNWVMFPNVYGMSQFASGPIMMTRPYFSSSNYIDKMSNYSKHKNKYPKIELDYEKYEWFDVWDAIYYDFINRHKNYLKKNYATSRQVTHWNNKSKKEQNKLLKIAEDYYQKY